MRRSGIMNRSQHWMRELGARLISYSSSLCQSTCFLFLYYLSPLMYNNRVRFIRVNGLVIILISIAGYSSLIYVVNSAVNSAWMSWIKPNICTHLHITPFHKAHKYAKGLDVYFIIFLTSVVFKRCVKMWSCKSHE